MRKVELIGEASYVKSVKEAGGVWILMEENKLYSTKAENGNNLFTWTSQEEAEAFAVKTKHKKLSGVFAPIEIILNSWLISESMQIVEVSACPRQGISTLTYTSEEYLETFKT
ncbi:MAG: hypothetical protein K6L75_08085 [Cellvibrionaceae bacterium]